MDRKKSESHLDVYENRYELHQNDVVSVYYEGYQNADAQRRYAKINHELEHGYLDKMISKLSEVDYSDLSERNKGLIKNLVDGITSEVGRALVGVAFLQLTIKSICPDQSGFIKVQQEEVRFLGKMAFL